MDLAEVHDATAFCELYQVEMLGFCEPGQGGPLVESGATTLGGRIPVNTSGGLVSKGHPVGATGLSMVAELAEQLRGEAGERQVARARIALAENGGGVIGFDEAAVAGDTGYLLRCEVRFPTAFGRDTPVATPFVHFDQGATRLIGGPRMTLAGAGAGVRGSTPDFVWEAVISTPLRRPEALPDSGWTIRFALGYAI